MRLRLNFERAHETAGLHHPAYRCGGETRITPFSNPLLGTILVTSHFTDNIVRVGLNYQFH
jgi:hypothetical protein